MTKYSISYFPMLCLFFLASCIPSKKTSLEAFQHELYTPQYASGFKILGADNIESTLIQVSNPWQGSKDVEMYYFISRHGERPPTGFTGPVISAGAKRIVCMIYWDRPTGLLAYPALIIYPIPTFGHIKIQLKIWAQRSIMNYY